ncbi:MAG: class I SAM-dependent methyltransferase [Mycobacteriales bacterium]
MTADGEGSRVYAAARAYEVAFSYRDIAAEVDALLAWSTKASGRPADSVLELAAGPADHALEFARRGLRATALDRSPAMCARARERATELGRALSVIEADMRGFQLPATVNLAIIMVNSTTHLLTLDDFVAHLGAVRAALRPGGCYILEMGHPADFLTRRATVSTNWSATRDEEQVRTQWGTPADPFDPISQVTQARVVLDYQRTGQPPVRIEDTVAQRCWTATEVEAAVRLAGGLQIAASYGSFASTRLDADDAWRMISVLLAT